MSTAASITISHLCEALTGFRDIPRQRSATQLERELAEARADEGRERRERERLAARLNNLLDALPGGVVVLDQRGTVQEFNPAAVELLGPLSRGEAWAGVVGRAFAPRWDDGHDVSLTDGRRVNIATQALSGEPGQILLVKDVTETRLLQDQLAHHKRLSAKTEMAAAMAHQIRTPLAAALLNLGNLRRARDEAGRERALERGLMSLRKLERLVDEMLLFARGGQLAVEAVEVDALYAALEAAADENFHVSGFQVEFAPCAASGRLYVNQPALTSVVLNLIDNACHACRGEGRIALSATQDEHQLTLRFADQGPGIPVAQAEQIFEPFFTTRANGTGLGLPVARAVARAHGGELTLEACDGGACFVMTLPLIGAQHAGTDAHASDLPVAASHAG